MICPCPRPTSGFKQHKSWSRVDSMMLSYHVKQRPGTIGLKHSRHIFNNRKPEGIIGQYWQESRTQFLQAVRTRWFQMPPGTLQRNYTLETAWAVKRGMTNGGVLEEANTLPTMKNKAKTSSCHVSSSDAQTLESLWSEVCESVCRCEYTHPSDQPLSWPATNEWSMATYFNQLYFY